MESDPQNHATKDGLLGPTSIMVAYMEPLCILQAGNTLKHILTGYSESVLSCAPHPGSAETAAVALAIFGFRVLGFRIWGFGKHEAV